MSEDTALQTVEAQQMTVLGTEPAQIVARATEVANVLAPIIKDKSLYKDISGKRHVMAEGWATLMGLLNVDPIVDYCKRLDRDDEIAYEARVLLVRNGQTISAAETIASSREGASWARSEQGVKSMAQTRAFGKACRLKFSWIVVLAGYQPTPAEEMPDNEKPFVRMPQAKTSTSAPAYAPEAEHPNVEKAQKAMGGMASEKQRTMLFAKCKAAGITEDEFKSYIWEKFKIESTKSLRWQDVETCVKWIEAYHPATVDAK